MAKVYPAFISALEKTDRKFYQEVASILDLAMAPGELDGKTKILLAMTLDAMVGSNEGVKSLAKAARNMGVTDAQISEAMRIAYMVAGNKLLSASHAAFEG